MARSRAIDQADAIVERFPAFEASDIPEDALEAHPAVSAETVKGLR